MILLSYSLIFLISGILIAVLLSILILMFESLIQGHDLATSKRATKILAATIELDNKILTTVSKDSLFEMINNN